jgi:sugar lactone lactonase YvrE
MSRRNRYLSIAAVLICLVVVSIVFVQANDNGQVEVVRSFTDTETRRELPEGIAIDKAGNLYVSLGPPSFVGGGFGEIWKISPDGAETRLAAFPVGTGPAGLAVDAPGNVYFAYPTMPLDLETHGVYHLTGDGGKVRLPGSESIILPNGLAFDKQGNLYVSDSIMGAIWRIPRGVDAVPETWWFQHVTLAGCETDPFGANGVAFWKGSLYVSNTAKGLLVRIPILSDGSPGEPVIVAGEPDCDPENELYGMDGIALDVHGNIYALLVLQNKLVRIDPDDGTFTTLLNGDDDGLWNPASIAFGTGKGDRQSVFFTNYAVFDPPDDNLGPAVLKFDVGVPGLPLP